MTCFIKRTLSGKTAIHFQRGLSSCQNVFKCKVLVVGGGTGGCSVAWRLSRKLNNKDVIVLEPSKVHYYQPLFALVGAGMKEFVQSHRPTKSILPRNIIWFKDKVDEFDPCNNMVHTGCGYKVYYDFMVVAVGVKNDYQKILGLKEALNDPTSSVSTIYSPTYCEKNWCCAQKFGGGHAIFTFPRQSGKCSGAAQKIMHLIHDYWTQKKVHNSSSISYITAGDTIFGVPKYANALSKLAGDKNIAVNYGLELVEVSKRGAVFLDCNEKTITLPFNFLHVTPPMSPPACLFKSEKLVEEAGYLNVNQYTLQHKRYTNVFGVGDCIGTPNSKTAAAVAKQSLVVEKNLWNTMYGKPLRAEYDGYGACTVLTSRSQALLAEYLYSKKPHETFPFDQSKESRLLCALNNNVFPYIYWNKLIKGKWDGPTRVRKLINPLGL